MIALSEDIAWTFDSSQVCLTLKCFASVTLVNNCVISYTASVEVYDESEIISGFTLYRNENGWLGQLVEPAHGEI